MEMSQNKRRKYTWRKCFQKLSWREGKNINENFHIKEESSNSSFGKKIEMNTNIEIDFFFLKVFYSYFIYLFLYFWLCWVLISCEGSLQPRQAGATLHRGAGTALHRGARASHHRGPPPAAGPRLQTRRLSSRGSRAQTLRGMWDPPRPGPEPASPALAGRLSTTAPPGKP